VRLSRTSWILLAVLVCTGGGTARAATATGAGIGRYFPQERTFGHFGTEAGDFRTPTGIAFGPEGHLYVADYKNNTVGRFEDDGRFVSAVLPGPTPYETPCALAFDSKHNLYVVEEKPCQVRKFSPTGQLLATYGGTGAENGRFRNPRGIVVNAQGHIFVADRDNHRVQEFDSSFAWLRNLRYGDSRRRPAAPTGVAIDYNSRLWCAFPNIRRIVRFDPEGNPDLVCGEEGSALGGLEDPRYLAFDLQNNFFVTDYMNGRVQRYNQKGEFLFGVGMKGSGRGQFKGPQGIAINARGDVFIADSDNFRIQMLQINDQIADFNQANFHNVRKEYDKALDLYLKVIKKVPLHKEALDQIVAICVMLADQKKANGQLDAAKPYLDQILAIQPSNTMALQFKRYILWKNNKGLIYYITLGLGVFLTFVFLIATLIKILAGD
jgi:DNA-binding beta-propeller fold protein YncE